MTKTEGVALQQALEELAHWPDLPGIPFYVREYGRTELRAIPASEVRGIFEALSKHVDKLMPWAVEIVEDYHRLKRAEDEASS